MMRRRRARSSAGRRRRGEKRGIRKGENCKKG
jgi:hypothetical protein